MPWHGRCSSDIEMFDPMITLAGALVGFVVGLTGMGGGALLTPILVLFLGIDPLTAVSSDLVAAMVMKPVGGAVHMRRGTVNYGLVGWLMLGSIPAAFGAVIVLTRFADQAAVSSIIKTAIGVALLFASAALIVKGALAARRQATDANAVIKVKPIATLLIGVFGGTVVGLTSVGSGSLMIVFLMLIYPRLSTRALVGTDLVQAVPLVGSAAAAHLLFGHVQLGITGSLLVGALPAVYLGARISSKARDGLIRPVLAVVLIASGLKLLAVPNEVVAITLLAVATALFVVLRFGSRAASRIEAVVADAAAEPAIERESRAS